MTILLKRLELINFRNFAAPELRDLSLINLIIGPPNTGKTNILTAIHYSFETIFLGREIEVEHERYPGGKKLSIRCIFEIECNGSHQSIDFVLEEKGGKLTITKPEG